MTFTLPELPYAYDALGPSMSAETLMYHHDKHHQAYVTNANKLIETSGLKGKSLEEVVIGSYQKNPALFNNAAQHYNHIHFWKWMRPGRGNTTESVGLPSALSKKIEQELGGFDAFRSAFIEAGITQFGSGWAWLALDSKEGTLKIMKTPNGENPLVHGAVPLLGCDVWEHSYYIDYRNERPRYLETWFDKLINWDYVVERFESAMASL